MKFTGRRSLSGFWQGFFLAVGLICLYKHSQYWKQNVNYERKKEERLLGSTGHPKRRLSPEIGVCKMIVPPHQSRLKCPKKNSFEETDSRCRNELMKMSSSRVKVKTPKVLPSVSRGWTTVTPGMVLLSRPPLFKRCFIMAVTSKTWPRRLRLMCDRNAPLWGSVKY